VLNDAGELLGSWCVENGFLCVRSPDGLVLRTGPSLDSENLARLILTEGNDEALPPPGRAASEWISAIPNEWPVADHLPDDLRPTFDTADYLDQLKPVDRAVTFVVISSGQTEPNSTRTMVPLARAVDEVRHLMTSNAPLVTREAAARLIFTRRLERKDLLIAEKFGRDSHGEECDDEAIFRMLYSDHFSDIIESGRTGESVRRGLCWLYVERDGLNALKRDLGAGRNTTDAIVRAERLLRKSIDDAKRSGAPLPKRCEWVPTCGLGPRPAGRVWATVAADHPVLSSKSKPRRRRND
jgi:hypothetical protein